MTRYITTLFSCFLLSLLSLVLLVTGCAHHPKPTASSIVITASSAVAAGQTTQLRAVETDQLDQTTDITSTASWTSSNTSVAKVNAAGLVTGVAAGSAVITATYGGVVGTLPLTIGAAVVTHLTIAPVTPQLFTGDPQQFTAASTYSDGSTHDITSTVTWGVAPAQLATISAAGLLQPIAPGNITITATSGAIVATVAGAITNPVLTSVTIAPPSATITAGGTQQFTATGAYNDQTTKDLTATVAWSSSNTAALAINASGLATAAAVSAATTVSITANTASLSASVAVEVNPAVTMTGLVVEPTSGSIAQGTAQQNTATAYYSDGTQQDVTNQVTWSVAAAAALAHLKNGNTAGTRPRDTSADSVTVDQSGIALATAPGAANVQASLAGLQSQGVLLVRDTTVQSIAINTPDTTVPAGATQQLTLKGVFADGSTQDLSLTGNWQSSNPSVATIDRKGIVTAVSAGTATFSASFGGLSTQTGNIRVLASDLVSLTIKVPNAIDFVGGVQPLNVIGIYSDGSSQDLTPIASWRSSDTSILQVSNAGLQQTVGAGKAQITATVANFSAVTTLQGVATALVSLDILPANADFALGTNLQFTAIGHLSNGGQFDATALVLWTSADPTVLTIDENGLAKSGKAGSTTVTASLQGVSQVSPTANVTSATITGLTIAPTSRRIAIGTHGQFRVLGWFSDGSVEDVSDAVLWSVADATVASADDDGHIFGIAAGSSTVTANAGQASVTAPLTVTNATLLSTVIVPGNIEMPVLVQRQLSLIGNFSDGSTQDMSADAIWLSPTPSVAYATQTGASVGLTPGVGTIGAQLGNFTAATQVNVANVALTAISLTPADTVIRQQGLRQMLAVGTFSDGFQQDLYLNAIYAAADPKLVYLRAQGLAIGTGVGTTQITATFRGFQASTDSFRVESGTLQSIALTPSNPMATAGGTTQLTATGTYADGTTSDLSSRVVWISSNPAVLSVDNHGLATAHATSTPVTVTVTAQSGTTTQTFTVTITPASSGSGTVTALQIQPVDATIGAGSTRQFLATATYADGSTGNVSGAATWSSSMPAVATIDGSGLASGVGTGSTIVSATLNNVSASATLTVQDAPASVATLVSIAVSPASAAINAGATQEFTAAGTYSDGTIEDISSRTHWLSSNTSIATINSSGVATGVSAGSATITAELDGATGAASLTVNPVTPPGITVVALAVTPIAATIAAHATQQYAATATFSDGSTQTVTTAATWLSSSPAVATINQAGLATGIASGSSAIAATWNGATGNASLVVSGGGGNGNTTLTGITVTPASTNMAVGATQQYVATGTYSDGSTRNLTTSATWSSSSTGTASITSAGLATGAAAGTTTITAQSGSITGSAALTITASTATLSSVVVTPTSSQIVAGLSQQFTATGYYSDGSTRNISSAASWSSSNNAVALVNTTGQVTGLTPGLATITCTAGAMQSQTTVIITAATLQSLAISPSGASFAAGATQQVKLTGTFSNGSLVDLTSSATWSSLATAVATVSGTGLATGVAPGTAQISAAYQTQSVSTTVEITAAMLVSVAISPASATFAKGTTQQFTVLGTYSDGSTHDVTGQAAFLSSNANVLNISSAGTATGAGVGTAQITVNAAGDTASTQSVTITPATLASIAISPSSPTFAKGTTQKFTATGTLSDGTTQDLSQQVVWVSSNPQTATIDNSGLASSGTPGSTQISATFQGTTGTSGTAQVSSAALTSLAISPATAQIAKGTTQQFTATGTFSDGTTQDLSSTATWSSSSSTVASVSSSGLATGNNLGTAQISAAFGNSTASTSSFQVTPATLVSIAFFPSSPSVAAGTHAQVTVTGTFSDGSTQDLTSSATFSSSNPAAVTVDSGGVITGVAPGSSTVSIMVGGITSSFTAVTSAATLSSIAITPAMPPSFAKGAKEQFTATGTFSDGTTQDLTPLVTWTSSNPAVFTIDANGLATGTGTGTATLTATYQGQSVTTPAVQVTPAVAASITITPAGSSATSGSTVQFTATATYTDASTVDVTGSATWSSSNTVVATITPAGAATTIAPGSTTIAALYNSISASTALTVTPPVAPILTLLTITPTAASVAKGNTQQFAAMGTYSDGSSQNLTTQVTWQSSMPAIATINSAGLATSVSGGNTQIWATASGVSGVANLTVSAATLVSLSVMPATVTVANGTSQQYRAAGTLSDGSTQDLTTSVTWTSSNTAVAAIQASGLATASGLGSTTISAQAGAVSGTAGMTVTSATVVALVVTPPVVTLPAGGSQQLTVTATFTDGTSQNVTTGATYQSANTGVATVDSTGKITATGAGTSTITITLGGANTTVMVTGTSAVLTSIAVTPTNSSLAVGLSQQMTATGTFSDGSTENLTSSVVWTSSSPTVATVSTSGNVVVNQTGSATLTATSGSTAGSTTVTGISAVVTAIAISPTSVTLAVGQSQSFTATATLSNGTQQNVTSSAQWSTSDATKGTVSNAPNTNGLLLTTSAGTLIVTATLNTMSGSAAVTIANAVLTSLTVLPSPVAVSAGATQQMTVTGNYSDGSTADVTSTATWTSNNSATATVDASAVLHGVAPGSATVTARVGTVSQGDAVTVSSAVLRSIAINPALPTTPLGIQTQLSATGTYSDGSTANVTAQVQWSSSAPGVATVSTTGLVNTLSAGTAQLTASVGSISQQVPLTVTAAVLESIAVQAPQTSFALGLSLNLTAIGTYSDSTTQTLTGVVSWSSLTPSVGIVSSSGTVTGVVTGTFNAKAALGGVSGTLSITVTSAVLQSITITPANKTIVNLLGNATQYTAMGQFSDGSTQNLTATCHWAISSGLALGSISQTGTFSATGIGLGTITATFGSVTASTNFIVISVL